MIGDVGAARLSMVVGRKTMTTAPKRLDAVSKVINQWPPTVFCLNEKLGSKYRFKNSFVLFTNSDNAGVRTCGQKRKKVFRMCNLTRVFLFHTSANPAAPLQAPTPIFRIDVGYNSAVYTGIIVLPALIVNFPKRQRVNWNKLWYLLFLTFNYQS